MAPLLPVSLLKMDKEIVRRPSRFGTIPSPLREHEIAHLVTLSERLCL